MPANFKSDAGYAKLNTEYGGMKYREISEHMTKNGDRINNSGVRHVFLNAMEKIAIDICNVYDIKLSSKDVKKIAKHPEFQSAIAEIMHDGSF
jgi:hypothetical protein